MIHKKSQSICDNYFFKHTSYEKMKSLAYILSVECYVFLKLWEEMYSSFDRSCDKLREKTYKEGKASYMFFCWDFFLINIHEVCNSLESIEGNTKRKDDIYIGERRMYMEETSDVL